MPTCPFCATELLPDARFCHQCGAKTPHEPAAHTATEVATYDPAYPLNFRKASGIPSEIKQYFIQALDRRLRDTQQTRKRKEYVNRLMQSDFQEIFDLRARQLAEEAYNIHLKQEPETAQEVDTLLAKSFDGLLDYFMTKFTKDLNQFNIPEETLKYEGQAKTDINLQELVVDFLDLPSENLTVYTDFIKMPLRKLQTASRSFLFAEKDEKILLICDQTVFGTCREGFALTEKALYWKAHFKEPQQVPYAAIESVRNEQDWLLINDYYFNVNPSVNGKMIFLLNKLKNIS